MIQKRSNSIVHSVLFRVEPHLSPSRFPELRAQVDSSSAAWTTLSAAYWSDPKLQQQYPESAQGTKEFLRWAIASGDTVTTQAVIADEWLAPVSVSFFLAQYKSVYQSWLSSGNS